MRPFADREVDSDSAAVELLVGHGRSGLLGVLKDSIKNYNEDSVRFEKPDT